MSDEGRRPDHSLSLPLSDLFTEAPISTHVLELRSGQIVFDVDSPAKHVYVIQSGQVRIHQASLNGSLRLVEILGPGDWFGAAALARSERHGTRATAVNRSVVVEAPVDAVLEQVLQRPAAAAELLRQTAAKLRAAQEDAACLVFDDCAQRLVRALLHFSTSAAASVHDDGVVLRMTHEQLAQAVGAARETISLALTDLKERNLLRTGRNQLTFNPGTLRRVCLTDVAPISATPSHDALDAMPSFDDSVGAGVEQVV